MIGQPGEQLRKNKRTIAGNNQFIENIFVLSYYLLPG
jgi:hypothetical protein